MSVLTQPVSPQDQDGPELSPTTSPATEPSPSTPPPEGDDGPDPVLDGRTLRARRTRDAVVDALLVLQEEGDLTPTAQRVAARAGVALRTVYGHFADMEALWLEGGRRELAKITALADVPPSHLPLSERIERFCASRATVLEALLPVMRATRLRRQTSVQLDRNWRHYVAVGDAEVDAVFAPELQALPGAERAGLRHALYLVASSPAWDALRDDRALDPAQAASVMLAGVRHLLLQPAGRTP